MELQLEHATRMVVKTTWQMENLCDTKTDENTRHPCGNLKNYGYYHERDRCTK